MERRIHGIEDSPVRPEVAACFGSPDVNRFQDASCMFVVRRVSRLGFKCEEVLHQTFAKFGKVKKVLVTKGGKTQRRGPLRSRVAALGIVVMDSAAAVKKILSQGEDGSSKYCFEKTPKAAAKARPTPFKGGARPGVAYQRRFCPQTSAFSTPLRVAALGTTWKERAAQAAQAKNPKKRQTRLRPLVDYGSCEWLSEASHFKAIRCVESLSHNGRLRPP
eukprot:g8627.t1